MREYLEKNWVETEGKETMKLALKALMETVEAGSKNLEVAVMEKDSGLRLLKDDEVPPPCPSSSCSTPLLLSSSSFLLCGMESIK